LSAGRPVLLDTWCSNLAGERRPDVRRAFRYPVITRDGELMGYARVGQIEAIGC